MVIPLDVVRLIQRQYLPMWSEALLQESWKLPYQRERNGQLTVFAYTFRDFRMYGRIFVMTLFKRLTFDDAHNVVAIEYVYEVRHLGGGDPLLSHSCMAP